jgi:pSer/pThr/pTyr-binding forkhead associated (FHA) protein
MKLFFQILNSSSRGFAFETSKNRVRIGRTKDNDIVLNDRSVSRSHAVLVVDDGKVILDDLNSSNQTLVNGRPILGPATISGDAILTFGKVKVQLSTQGDQEVNMQSNPGINVSKQQRSNNLEKPARGSEPLYETTGQLTKRPTAGGYLEQIYDSQNKIWPVLFFVMGLLTAASLVIFFLQYGGFRDKPHAKYGVALRVGETKIVKVPYGFYLNPEINPPGILTAKQTLNLKMAVTLKARSAGMADVKLYNAEGDHVILHAKILGRESDLGEATTSYSPLTPEERRNLSKKHLRRAETLKEAKRLYEALQEYKKAIDILAPLSQTPPGEIRTAERWCDILEDQIENRYQQLQFEMTNLMQAGKKRRALAILEEIKELIPDKDDIRWQNADLLYRLLEQLVSEDRR